MVVVVVAAVMVVLMGSEWCALRRWRRRLSRTPETHAAACLALEKGWPGPVAACSRRQQAPSSPGREMRVGRPLCEGELGAPYGAGMPDTHRLVPPPITVTRCNLFFGRILGDQMRGWTPCTGCTVPGMTRRASFLASKQWKLGVGYEKIHHGSPGLDLNRPAPGRGKPSGSTYGLPYGSRGRPREIVL